MTNQHNKPNSHLSLFFWLPYVVLLIFTFIYLSYDDSTITISPYLFSIVAAIIIFAGLASSRVNDNRIKEIFNISPIVVISFIFIYYISIVENNPFVMASLVIILVSVMGVYHENEKQDIKRYFKNLHVLTLFSYFLMFAFIIMIFVSFKIVSGDTIFLLACTLGFTVFTPLLYLFYRIGSYPLLYVYTGLIDLNFLSLIVLKVWYL